MDDLGAMLNSFGAILYLKLKPCSIMMDSGLQ